METKEIQPKSKSIPAVGFRAKLVRETIDKRIKYENTPRKALQIERLFLR